MIGHYGLLSEVARRGKAAMTKAARSRFRELFGIEISETRVLGGFELLEEFSGMAAEALYDLWCRLPMHRLGSGQYCARLRLEGETVFVLNGFVPSQLQTYTDPNHALAVFTVNSDLSWTVARQKFLGGPDPTKAAPGSLRNELYVHCASLGLRDVSLGTNGAHCSAGPIEAVVELARLTSDYTLVARPITDFQFGRKLIARFPATTVEWVLGNPTVPFNEREVSLYELTEETNEAEALEVIGEARCILGTGLDSSLACHDIQRDQRSLGEEDEHLYRPR